MHLIYLDEVKYKIPEQPYYWLCGYAVDQEALLLIDQNARDIAKWYFGSERLTAETEFHAKHIANGSGNFKKHEVAKRIELYHKFIDCLCNSPSTKTIEVRIDPSKIVYDKDPVETAFMFFVEKSDELMKENKRVFTQR